MIVVRVELWPKGDERSARLLGIGTIANDGTGTLSKGNYSVMLTGERGRPVGDTAAVRGFPRLQKHAWDLVYRALRGAVGQRNLPDPLNTLQKHS